MWSIIGGMFLMSIGSGFFYGSGQQRVIGGALVLFGIGLPIFLYGLYVMLDGFREFILQDVLTELKKIAGNTTPKA